MISETTRLKRAAADLEEYRLKYQVAAIERRHAAFAAEKAGVIMPRIAEHLGTTLRNAYVLIDKARNETEYHGMTATEIRQTIEKAEAKKHGG